jgi:hypothetical protein
MKRKTVRIDFGTSGVVKTVRDTRPARIIRDLTVLSVTVADLRPGDLVLFSPNDEPNYEALVAAGGIATLVPVVGVSPGRRAAR